MSTEAPLNRKRYDIKQLYFFQEISEEIIGSPIPEPRQRSRLLRSQSESSDEVTELDLSHGKKDAFVLEVYCTEIISKSFWTICIFTIRSNIGEIFKIITAVINVKRMFSYRNYNKFEDIRTWQYIFCLTPDD